MPAATRDNLLARQHMRMMQALFGYPQRFGFGAWGRLIRATLTGSVNGVRIKNRLWFWCYALAQPAINLLCLLLGAAYGVIMLVAMWFCRREAPLALCSETGITLQQKRPAFARHLRWEQLSEVRSVIAPPVAYWVLVLHTGEQIALPPMTRIDTAAITARGIPVMEAPQASAPCRAARQ